MTRDTAWVFSMSPASWGFPQTLTGPLDPARGLPHQEISVYGPLVEEVNTTSLCNDYHIVRFISSQ